jgi:hypothetical protein
MYVLCISLLQVNKYIIFFLYILTCYLFSVYFLSVGKVQVSQAPFDILAKCKFAIFPCFLALEYQSFISFLNLSFPSFYQMDANLVCLSSLEWFHLRTLPLSPSTDPMNCSLSLTCGLSLYCPSYLVNFCV